MPRFSAQVIWTWLDVVAVPERLEDGVGEAQHHEVLRGLLAEVVVDPVGVLFLEGVVDDLVEVAGGGEVGAEGFLDDHARPAAVGGLVEAGIFQVDEDVVEELRGGGDVEQAVALAAARGIDGIEFLREAAVALGIGELGLVIVDRFDERIPDCLVVAGARNLAVDLGEPGAELLVGFFPPGEADDFHAGRQFAIDGEVVERGDELAVGEVAGGAEDDDGAGLGASSGRRGLRGRGSWGRS